MKERKSAVRKQFNHDAESYRTRYLTPQKIREKDRIIDLMDCGKRYGRILDLGCGPGMLTGSLLELGDEIYGIDLSEDMIKKAVSEFRDKDYDSKVFFSVGDAEKLDFPDSFFDAVVCLGLLRYLDSLEKGLSEIHRVLKPEGVMIGTFYSRYSLYWLSMILFYRPLLPLISIIKGLPLRDLMIKYKAEPSPFTYRRFRKLFSEAGFIHSDTLYSGIDLFPANRLFPRFSESLSLGTESVLHRSERFGWIGSVFIVKGLKK